MSQSPTVDHPTPLSAPPLQPGCLVTYRDEDWRLCGGADERDAGTVLECCHGIVLLTNGQRVPLHRILAVAKTDEHGRILAAWTVREHGHDGEGSQWAEKFRAVGENETEYEGSE